jgi:hypothetical protein
MNASRVESITVSDVYAGYFFTVSSNLVYVPAWSNVCAVDTWVGGVSAGFGATGVLAASMEPWPTAVSVPAWSNVLSVTDSEKAKA